VSQPDGRPCYGRMLLKLSGEALMGVVEKSGLGPNKTFMPIRLAVTGKKISPPIDFTLALLPKDVALSRLQRAVGGSE